MGEQHLYQPLTKDDKITVVLYRIGIVLSAIIISIAAYMLFISSEHQDNVDISAKINMLLSFLYISVGMSVFLYIFM